MLTKIVVSNFRSLGEAVEIPLGRLTALVGINGAGKSSIIDAVRFVSECARDGLSAALLKRNGLSSIQHRSGRPNPPVSFKVEQRTQFGSGVWEFALQDDGRGDFEILRETASWEPDQDALAQNMLQQLRQLPRSRPDPVLDKEIERLEAGGHVKGSVEPIASGASVNRASMLIDPGTLLFSKSQGNRGLSILRDELQRIACYTVFPEQLRPPQKPDSVRRPMDEHGANWATTLRRLPRESAGQELVAALGRIVGDITDYRVLSVGGYLVTEFLHGQDRWLDASLESDGTLRLACLLTAILQEPPLALIGMEEPELTVHAGALPILFDFLREATQRSQVLLSTHSPELLDLLDPSELLVVTRDGSTRVSPMAEDQMDALKHHLLSPSDLLRAEGLRPRREGGAHG
jgi:predicted ATPase